MVSGYVTIATNENNIGTGGFIEFHNSRIVNNTVPYNSSFTGYISGTGGAGVTWPGDYAYTNFIDCEISNNYAQKDAGYIYTVSHANYSRVNYINGTTFSGNIGEALNVDIGNIVEIHNSTFTGTIAPSNQVTGGAGLAMYLRGNVTLSRTVVTGINIIFKL